MRPLFVKLDSKFCGTAYAVMALWRNWRQGRGKQAEIALRCKPKARAALEPGQPPNFGLCLLALSYLAISSPVTFTIHNTDELLAIEKPWEMW
jgi:hypothetical protein